MIAVAQRRVGKTDAVIVLEEEALSERRFIDAGSHLAPRVVSELVRVADS
jgi:hypothetical protein